MTQLMDAGTSATRNIDREGILKPPEETALPIKLGDCDSFNKDNFTS